MADLGPPDVAGAVDGEQPGAIGRPGIERARPRALNGADGTVRRREPGCRPPTPCPPGLVLHDVSDAPGGHGGVVVRQVKDRPRTEDGRPAPRLEAQEPHPGQALVADVGPDVRLGERAEPGDRGHPARGHVGHHERDDADPGHSVEELELEARDVGQETRGDRGLDRPVREQQVEPAHPKQPRSTHGGEAAQPSGTSSSPGSANAVVPRADPAAAIASR